MHGSVHLAVAIEERRVGKQCVRGIEKREFHVLKSSDVCHLCADFLPCGATSSKVVLDDPLYEVLTIYRRLVLCAILLVESLDVLGMCGWSDAIDHRVGESHVLLHPCRKLLVLRLYKRHESAAGRIAIVLKIVTREDGDRA